MVLIPQCGCGDIAADLAEIKARQALILDWLEHLPNEIPGCGTRVFNELRKRKKVLLER